MQNINIDQQKYDRILAAALNQFAKHGYQKANTDEIAKEAGVSKGLIFHYFGKKHVLYESTLSNVIDFLMNQSNTLFTKTYTDLAEVVVVSTQHKIKLEQEYPNHVQLLLMAYGRKKQLPKQIQRKLSDYMDENKTIAYQLLTGIIEHLPIKKEIAKQDIIQLVLGVLNQLYMESIQFINRHPDVTEINQMEFLAKRAETYMRILQTGFLENKAEEK